MQSTRDHNIRIFGFMVAGALVALIVLGGYLLNTRAPSPGTKVYESYATAFQLGVAALDADLIQEAEANLTTAVELVPKEAAGWANRGLLYLRSGRLDEAESDLQQATRLAASHPGIEKLVALLRQRMGQYSEAAGLLRRAIERDPADVKSMYQLTKIIDQESLAGSDAEHQLLLEKILAVRPHNLKILMEHLRLAVRRSDAAGMQFSLNRFNQLAATWSERTQRAFDELKKSLNDNAAGSLPRLLGFSNVLLAERAFPGNAAEVEVPDAFIGDSLPSFLWLAPIRHTPAKPDTQLAFVTQELKLRPSGVSKTILPIWLTSESLPEVLVASESEVRIGEGRAIASPSLAPQAVVCFDANNDLRMDLMLVGKQGLRFHRQQADGSFSDLTAETGLSDEVLSTELGDALAADIDLDGDLDVVVARLTDTPWFLRNNFDNSFTVLPFLAPLIGPQAFLWADFDHDGAPDLAVLDDAGELRVFANERSGEFSVWSAPPPSDRLLAITAVDANDDGVLDIVAVRQDGALLSISDHLKRSSWQVAELSNWDRMPRSTSALALLAEDFDNNGVLDLLASGSEGSLLWLGAGNGRFLPHNCKLPAKLMGSMDLDNDGRMDLLGIDAVGSPSAVRNVGQQSYHWQTVRPQAARGEVVGDNRINSFGIGGAIELRAGTHVVKQAIRAPSVHFGLGQRPQADLFRLEWPNGTFQFEFKPAVDLAVTAVQRLKGSCPFLFAWNGEQFAFITDFMWSTPLGMYINAADKGGFLQTTDWVKIPAEQLVANAGIYELRVNANLWETHYFDHMTLMTIDHPADTEMFVDERFFFEPTQPKIHYTSAPHRVARATDQCGRDVTDVVAVNDGKYCDPGPRGLYQGVMQDHWIEIELAESLCAAATAHERAPVWLIAKGWIHPTDSSVNYAITQGKHVAPQGLVLEVADGLGGWKIARDRLGFPAGKNKTVLLRLDDLGADLETAAGMPLRLRLRTNLEIYWDSILIARGVEEVLQKVEVLDASVIDLRSRGILAMTQSNASSPELPHYEQIIARGQYWRDLIGYHTRYGDVHELMSKVDDRYAILCGGDEVIFRFKAPADPPAGWKRDFVWLADGWVKDGDFNTRFGKTVLPLPSHAMQAYDLAPQQLENDPVYQRFPADWENYHTRYVTPYFYEQGLRHIPISRPTSERGKP